jgi:ADP-heptose:LPS heptosyltransferase
MTRATAGPLDRIEPGSVCLIKPSSLGDVVHALPVLSALRDRWPRARFAWVVNRGLRGLVEGHPALDEVIPFDRGRVGLGPGGLARFGWFAAGLRRQRFELVVDLQGLFRSGLMAGATGARWRVGMAEAREGATLFYTHCIATGGTSVHAVDRLMHVASAFGADVEGTRFVVPMSDDDRRWASEALSAVPLPRLVLNVGARWLTKRWPPSSFAEVARRAAAERGAGLVAVGAPEDRPLVHELIRALDPLHCLNLCGATTLPRLAAIASASDCFLSNDTGPLHLAAAAGARVVGVYTCTDPARTGPYGPSALAVRSCIWCAPSFVKRCDRLDCMAELTPERVWPAVDRQLAASGCPVGSAMADLPPSPLSTPDGLR